MGYTVSGNTVHPDTIPLPAYTEIGLRGFPLNDNLPSGSCFVSRWGFRLSRKIDASNRLIQDPSLRIYGYEEQGYDDFIRKYEWA